MLRRLSVAFVAILLVGACIGAVVGVVPGTTSTAAALQTVSQDDKPANPAPSDPALSDPGLSVSTSPYGDHELIELLNTAELLDEWVEASNVSPEASLVALVPAAMYDVERTAFLVQLERFVERRDQIIERAATIDALERDVDVVQQLTRDLRRSLLVDTRRATLSFPAAEVAQARLTLASVIGQQRWMGMSLDPAVLAEHRLAEARDELAREVDGLAGLRDSRDKGQDAAIARLTDLQRDLELVRSLLDDARQTSVPSQFELAATRSSIVDVMAPLHDRRLLLSTIVGGLPVVTLDAYVEGANALDASCPVEWNLLAGIGRVESFHGTIGGSTVQASGRVSNPILGPLLDGGATAREAAAAVAAAQAAAEAALLEQESFEPEAPETPEFDATVWGDDTLERAEALEASAAEGHEAVGRAAPPVVIEAEPPPRYDPLLWGSDLPFDDDDLEQFDDSSSGDSSDAAEGEEAIPEFRGNGFAVIHDSDNGRLDGNGRWDRAVGPMQFIPETWAYWEADGNSDGTIDPQNLYDAAATAGRFLCHLSKTRGSSPYTFVLGYNGSDTYVRNVMAVADAFGASPLPTID